MPGALNVLNPLLDLVLPPRCGGCAAPGAPLCAVCRSGFTGPLPAPRAPLAGGPEVYALADHRDAPRRALLAYKEQGRRDLAPPLGGLLAGVLPALPPARPDADGVWWLVPVPSRRSSARQRGGAHVLRLARHCAAALAAAGRPAAVAPALRMDRRVRDSVGLSAPARAANVAGRVHVVEAGLPPPGTPVVVVDDVVTTGATAAACAGALSAAGVVVTTVLSLTRAGG